MSGAQQQDHRRAPAALPQWARELLGAAVAVATGIGVVAAVAASARSELLFRDADSLVTTLIVHSLAQGAPQDWALSSVLFLPETAVLALLTTLGLGINGTLALAGVVNVVALYGALRVAAGSVARASAPITGALLALGAFALLAASESSPSRDALELASLLTTTTYYSATVIGVVVAVGLARRALDRTRVSRGTPGGGDVATATATSGVTTRGNPHADPAQRDTRTPHPVPWGSVAGIGLVAAASVLTNPLFAVWATVPLVLVLGFAALRERSALWLAGGLVAGSLLGFVGRMPLAHLIANTGAGYLDPSQWPASLEYYGALFAERGSAPWGAASVVAVVALWGWSIAATVLLARRRDLGATVVAACGWVMPLLVAIGAVAAGTHAARYLQPVVFASLLGLVVLPALLPRPASALRPVLAIGAAALALVVAVSVGVPRIATVATAPDADLGCVVDWAEASGRTGAGQFWTVRLPKAHLADPRGLVQVDHQLRGYAWLVNRDDFAVGEVSFLVLDAQSPAFDLPEGFAMTVPTPPPVAAGSSPEPHRIVGPTELIACGRYTIADFGSHLLPLGPQRS